MGGSGGGSTRRGLNFFWRRRLGNGYCMKYNQDIHSLNQSLLHPTRLYLFPYPLIKLSFASSTKILTIAIAILDFPYFLPSLLPPSSPRRLFSIPAMYVCIVCVRTRNSPNISYLHSLFNSLPLSYRCTYVPYPAIYFFSCNSCDSAR